MKMKKILSLILALLMVLSLVACGSKDNDKEPDTDNGGTTFNNVKISAGSGTSGGGQYVYTATTMPSPRH